MGNKTIFISHRRDALGNVLARLVKQGVEQKGYDVFLDLDNLEAGNWENQLLAMVTRRAHFILLLTPNALDRCADANDMLRREYETAVTHNRNIVPIVEESVDIETMKRSCPECVRSIFTRQIAQLRYSAFDADLQSLTRRFLSPQHEPSSSLASIAKPLASSLANLQIGQDVRDSITGVLSHPDFPVWMSIAGRIVLNPAWSHYTASEQAKATERYKVCGPYAPTVLHTDVLLIRRDDKYGIGELFAFPSPRWNIVHFPFRARLPGEDRAERHTMSARHLAKYWHLPAEHIKVNSLSGLHCVSAKMNDDYHDLFLYVLEFCSVKFVVETDEINEVRNRPGAPWFHLDALRTNDELRKKNGDLIRALHELFTASLGPLPNSFANSQA